MQNWHQNNLKLQLTKSILYFLFFYFIAIQISKQLFVYSLLQPQQYNNKWKNKLQMTSLAQAVL